MLVETDTRISPTLAQIGITLFRDAETGQWFAERLDFRLTGTQTRITFTLPQPVDEAFTPEFHEALRPYLPTSLDRGLLADSLATIDLPHLSLEGVRVVAQSALGGIQKVWVRFQRALGAVQSLLQPRHRTERSTAAALDCAAGTALLDLLRPCLDLIHVDVERPTSQPIAERLIARLRTLQQKKSELEFFAGLLTRHIMAQARSQAPADQALAPATRPIPVRSTVPRAAAG